MEEKKVIKVKISTLLLILAIIGLGVMGYFIFKLNDDKIKSEQQVSELKKQITTLESEINTQKQKENYNSQNVSKPVTNNNTVEEKTTETTSNINTFTSVKGIYKAEVADHRNIAGNNKGEVQLTLNEDGTFAYFNVPNLEVHDEGYYTIDGDSIILHVLLHCGNDIGASMADETIKVKYNKDNVVDSDKLNVTLVKSSDKLTENNTNLLYNSIKSRIKENVIQ